MIISFSRKKPWGDETKFMEKCQSGEKKHTFRMGKRWKVGQRIHFWDQNPRSSMMIPSPQSFNIPYDKSNGWKMENGLLLLEEDRKDYSNYTPTQKEATPVVDHVDDWKMVIQRLPTKTHFQIWLCGDHFGCMFSLIDNGGDGVVPVVQYRDDQFDMETVANNDGLTLADFVFWFSFDLYKKNGPKKLELEGQLVHWTNLKY